MVRSILLFVAAVAGLAAILLPGQGGAGAKGSAGGASERPEGTIVLLSGTNRLTAIDVASGRRATRRVRSVASCGSQMYVTGGHVIVAGVRKGRTVVFSLPLSLDRPPTRLGVAHAFVPSATAGRVWLAGVDCDRQDMVGVREVTVDGRVTMSSDRRVPAGWVTGAVHGGLVVQREDGIAVWDPRTGRSGSRLRLDAVTGSRGNLLAGCVERPRCRGIEIVDTASARTVAARKSDHYRLDPGGGFSPDGSLLATAARVDGRWSVALVNTRTGTHALLPGLRSTGYPQLSWAPSGWLFARLGGARRIMAYRPGAPRAVTLPFRLPRGFAFVAG